MNNIVPKIAVSLICTIVIVLLFFFGGRILPEEESAGFGVEDKSYLDSFRFDPEQLSYDGTGDLDLLEGVSLDGYTPQDLKATVFTRIYKGDTLSEKYIEYTAETEEGMVRSRRKLRLRDYNGPKIVIPDEIPSVNEESADEFAGLLKTKSGYAVDDGFGNNARDYAEISYEKEATDSALLHYTIAFDNMFGDRDVAKIDVTLTDVPARIILSDSEVTIPIGGKFDPASYIVSAERADGTSAIESVILSGNVDTMQEGTYTLTYDLDGQTATIIVNVVRDVEE